MMQSVDSEEQRMVKGKLVHAIMNMDLADGETLLALLICVRRLLSGRNPID